MFFIIFSLVLYVFELVLLMDGLCGGLEDR